MKIFINLILAILFYLVAPVYEDVQLNIKIIMIIFGVGLYIMQFQGLKRYMNKRQYRFLIPGQIIFLPLIGLDLMVLYKIGFSGWELKFELINLILFILLFVSTFGLLKDKNNLYSNLYSVEQPKEDIDQIILGSNYILIHLVVMLVICLFGSAFLFLNI